MRGKLVRKRLNDTLAACQMVGHEVFEAWWGPRAVRNALLRSQPYNTDILWLSGWRSACNEMKRSKEPEIPDGSTNSTDYLAMDSTGSLATTSMTRTGASVEHSGKSWFSLSAAQLLQQHDQSPAAFVQRDQEPAASTKSNLQTNVQNRKNNALQVPKVHMGPDTIKAKVAILRKLADTETSHMAEPPAKCVESTSEAPPRKIFGLKGYAEPVPLSWFLLHEELEQLKIQGTTRMSLDEMRVLATQFGIGKNDAANRPDYELVLLLRAFTDTGVLKHTDEPGVRDMVVINLQWLVDVQVELLSERAIRRNLLRSKLHSAMATVRRPRLHPGHVTSGSRWQCLRVKWQVLRWVSLWMTGIDAKMDDSVLSLNDVLNIWTWPVRPTSTEEWQRLSTRGQLKITLLQDMWPDLKQYERLAMLSYATQYGLCCTVPEECGERGLYVVPALLPHATPRDDWITDVQYDHHLNFHFIHADSSWQNPYRRGFLPESLYHQLVAMLLKYATDVTDSLRRLFNHATTFYGDEHFHTQLHPGSASIQLIVRETERGQAATVAKWVSQFLDEISPKFGAQYRQEVMTQSESLELWPLHISPPVSERDRSYGRRRIFEARRIKAAVDASQRTELNGLALEQVKTRARQLGIASDRIEAIDHGRGPDGALQAAVELVIAETSPRHVELTPPDQWPAIDSLSPEHPAVQAVEVWTSPVDLLRYHTIWLGRNRQFRAAAKGNVAKVKLWLSMLAKRADIDAQTAAYNYTSFCIACEYGHVEIVKLLLERGADPCIPNYLNLTGRECAERANQTAVLELLRASKHPALVEEIKRAELRPMTAVVQERLEIAWDRLCFWELCPYSSWDKLSEGTFGVVWAVEDVFPPFTSDFGETIHRKVVVKSVKTDAEDGSHTQDELVALSAEIRTLAKLKHERIVKTFGFVYGAPPHCTDPNQPTELADEKSTPQKSWMMILERCEADLGYLIHKREDAIPKGLPDIKDIPTLLQLAKEIVEGLEYIHGSGFLHLDIKPGNVLVAKDNHGKYGLKVADFGMGALPSSEVDAQRQDYGTYEYMSPEAWSGGTGRPGKASDVFSFGLLFWEMCTRARVYASIGKHHCRSLRTGVDGTPDLSIVPAWLAKHNLRPHIDESMCPAPLPTLMQACWEADMAQRPTFKQVEAALKDITRLMEHSRRQHFDDNQVALDKIQPKVVAKAVTSIESTPAEAEAAVPTVQQWLESIGMGSSVELFIEMSGLQEGKKYLEGVKTIENDEFRELLDDLQDLDGAVDEMVGEDEDELTEDEAEKLKAALRALHKAGIAAEPALAPALSHWEATLEWLRSHGVVVSDDLSLSPTGADESSMDARELERQLLEFKRERMMLKSDLSHHAERTKELERQLYMHAQCNKQLEQQLEKTLENAASEWVEKKEIVAMAAEREILLTHEDLDEALDEGVLHVETDLDQSDRVTRRSVEKWFATLIAQQNQETAAREREKWYATLPAQCAAAATLQAHWRGHIVRQRLTTAVGQTELAAYEQRLARLKAERDALLELKREREERQRAEANAALARTRSAEKRQQLEAAKEELARLKAMKASAASAPPRAKSPVEEELDAAMAERDALLELKREREERQRAEANAALARTRSAEKRQQLEAAKAELARLKAMKASAASAPPRAKSPVEEEPPHL